MLKVFGRLFKREQTEKPVEERKGPMPGQDQFEEIVFPAELEEINERRDKYGLGKAPKGSGPSTNKGLIGLALSGGGIRSATFSLGVLQALAKEDVLKNVDYLSTVSGGGYIGSCVTSLLTSDDEAGVRLEDNGAGQFPLGFPKSGIETPAVQNLRNYSNYLTPRPGLFKLGTWKIIGWYVGSLFLNLMTAFSVLAFMVLFFTYRGC
jgi:predicted acylesterase/phospholipase RssA